MVISVSMDLLPEILTQKEKLLLVLPEKLKGKLFARTQKYPGIIEGKITVGQLLNLKASSKIHGDIATSKLSIEPGAVFSGNCKMSDNDNNVGAGIIKEKEPEKPSK